MSKPLFMHLACFSSLVVLALGCSGVSNAVDDAATVRVGAESLRAVEIERSMTLGVERIPGCLDFSATLESSNTTVALGASPTGCTLTVDQPGLVLLDDQALERARQESGDFDVSGIRGASLDVQQLDLSTADGEPLTLSKYIDTLSVTVDGAVLLDHVEASELEGGNLSRDLPDSLIEKLKTSLKDNRAATADVGIALGLRKEGLLDLPDALTLRVVIQPELLVNVIDAAL
jgi:hypothetical protein